MPPFQEVKKLLIQKLCIQNIRRLNYFKRFPFYPAPPLANWSTLRQNNGILHTITGSHQRATWISWYNERSSFWGRHVKCLQDFSAVFPAEISESVQDVVRLEMFWGKTWSCCRVKRIGLSRHSIEDLWPIDFESHPPWLMLKGCRIIEDFETLYMLFMYLGFISPFSVPVTSAIWKNIIPVDIDQLPHTF